MTPGTAPGVAIFSAEWMDEVAPEIEGPERDLILDLCRAFDLGNSTDPRTILAILHDHFDVFVLPEAAPYD